MRKARLPNDMTPSPRPWAWGIVPSKKNAIVKGADGSVVCVCHPSNAKEMCGGTEPVEDIYAYGAKESGGAAK